MLAWFHRRARGLLTQRQALNETQLIAQFRKSLSLLVLSVHRRNIHINDERV
ncbi:MAG: hypothetical protein R3C05_28690 [Pirellulaceae bacterium]